MSTSAYGVITAGWSEVAVLTEESQLAAARLAHPLARLVPGQSMLAQRLRAMLSLAPSSIPATSQVEIPKTYPAIGERRARVALLTGLI